MLCPAAVIPPTQLVRGESDASGCYSERKREEDSYIINSLNSLTPQKSSNRNPFKFPTAVMSLHESKVQS